MNRRKIVNKQNEKSIGKKTQTQLANDETLFNSVNIDKLFSYWLQHLIFREQQTRCLILKNLKPYMEQAMLKANMLK